ncbi:MAG: phosphoethanolamine--lipid A transferase [Arcobacteraceae bacterium]
MKLTTTKLIIFVSLFLVIFDNYSFFKNLTDVYPINKDNLLFLSSLCLVLISLIVFLFTLVSFRFIIKPIMIVIVMVSAFTNYFMNTYNVVIDTTMIQNIMNTDFNESLDLFSLKLVGYIVFLGVIPSYIIFFTKLEKRTFKIEFFSRVKLVVVSLLVIGAMVYSLSNYYSSFFREHKILRLYTNPIFYIYSSAKYINGIVNSGSIEVEKIGLDAKIEKSNEKKRVVVMVVGEATRADRFSLNGYERETNRLVSKEGVINLGEVSSCGTSTAVSVPCMFSIYNRNDYSYKKQVSTENVIDVLTRAGVNVLWRDNNSNWEDVARGATYQNYKTNEFNKDCEGECRDMGMIDGLDEYIKNTQGDIFIVLHQMGNHGPAYYKRYPKNFEEFKPVCQTNQLEKCTPESIGNAYDNTLLYTDYFLSNVINLLKSNEEVESAMFYMSDHGESLGENGVYLHGLPYFMAPKEQTHVGSFLWFSENFKQNIDIQSIKINANNEYSQDNLFHTILGMMSIQTEVYDKKMDILQTK